MSWPLVSVSGVRGIVEESFTEEIVRRWAAAFAAWIGSRQQAVGSRAVVLGRDTRPSGAWALRVAVEMLVQRGIQSIVLGIVPTPTAQLAVTHHRAAGGLVITGSHNPAEWNALKFLGPDGVYLSETEMEELHQRVIASEAQQSPGESTSAGIASSSRPGGTPRNDVQRATDERAIERHIDNVLMVPPIDAERIRARTFRVVVDPVNGAGALALPPLLERLGCTVTVINGEPTGVFAHPPEPMPEHLTELGAKVWEAGADLGLAVDPDADRLALVDELGHVLSEEYTVTLATLAVLARNQESPDFAKASPGRRIRNQGTVVIINLSTTRMVEDVARGFGATVVRTPVGERHVVEGMRAHGALIGGEGNGGVIYAPIHEGRDSLVGAALLLDLLARRGVPLSVLVSELPRYVMRKEKLPRTGDWAQERVAGALARAFQGAELATLDGVRVDTADGWVHLRPSNTEPAVRLIGEARDEATLHRLLASVRAAVAVPAS